MGTRPHVTFVHGLGFDSSMWNRCLPLLSQDCEISTVELLGHGDNPAVPSDVTLSDLAAAVAERLVPGTHLVGFSLGGLVALRIALDHPELVRSLILVSTVGRRTAAEREVVRERVKHAETDFDSGVDEMIARWFKPSWRERDGRLVQELSDSLRRNHRPSYLTCFRLFAEADAQLSPHLHRVRIPTTVITGAQDTGATPAMAVDLAGGIPGSCYYVIPDAAHLLPLERPHAVAAAVVSHLSDDRIY